MNKLFAEMIKYLTEDEKADLKNHLYSQIASEQSELKRPVSESESIFEKD